MQARPTISELLDAVRHHLADEVLPTIQDPRLRFRTLVAAHVLGVATRELALAGEQSHAEWNRLARLLEEEGAPPVSTTARYQEIEAMNHRLCQLIEAGAFDREDTWQGLLAHCRTTAREKLLVSNPRFLKRLDGEQRQKKSPANSRAVG